MIHIVGVPLLFTTALRILKSMTPFGVVESIWLLYAVPFIKMEPLAGLLYTPVLGGMYWLGTSGFFANRLQHAVALHLAGWIAQFIGHGVFEKRKPALMDNLTQSLHAAVFFVWLQLLFRLGYKPTLRKELHDMVVERMKAFKDE